MAEVYDEVISKYTDWGGDESTCNIPVSGRQVQDFIKRELSKKIQAVEELGQDGVVIPDTSISAGYSKVGEIDLDEMLSYVPVVDPVGSDDYYSGLLRNPVRSIVTTEYDGRRVSIGVLDVMFSVDQSKYFQVFTTNYSLLGGDDSEAVTVYNRCYDFSSKTWGDWKYSSGEGDAIYIPSVEYKDLSTNVSVGGIDSNTELSSLSGMSFSEILEKMLVKLFWTAAPKHSISFTLGQENRLVAVGSKVIFPAVKAIWNEAITAEQGKSPKVEGTLSFKLPDNNEYDNSTIENDVIEGNWDKSDLTYDKVGIANFEFNYKYPSGVGQIKTTNQDIPVITKNVTIPGVSGNTSTIDVKVVYPWYISGIIGGVEKENLYLTEEGSSATVTLKVGGSPVIKVPYTSSTIEVLADIGNGLNPVANWKTGEDEVINGIKYRVYYKGSSYGIGAEPTHKITITIIKDNTNS